jgi:ribosomal subunit interface protein
MNTRIKATNVSITPAISEYADKRLEKISKLLANDPSAICDVELARTSEHHNKGDVFKVDIHVVAKGIDAYASVEHEDLYTAITDSRDEILAELRGNKGKRVSLIRRSGARVKAMVKGIWPFK